MICTHEENKMTNSETTSSETTSNLALLRGVVAGELISRELPSGSTVVQFDVSTTIVAGEKAAKASVPVSWLDPPSKALESISQGLDVVVVGTVRRRFFRAGGSTQSRTEVVVDAVVPARRTKQVRTLITDTAARVAGAL
jgi:single-strand DNA-binding protein